VKNISGTLFVAYAKQDAQKHDDVGGPGNGYVAMFNLNGNLIANLVSEGPLNSPWGMAIAPANFGPFAGALLVGNFLDGKVNAFNATTGAMLGTLNDTTGNPITIPGLWSLDFRKRRSRRRSGHAIHHSRNWWWAEERSTGISRAACQHPGHTLFPDDGYPKRCEFPRRTARS
jgi:uncharacterized protein (TIGR03118 family)